MTPEPEESKPAVSETQPAPAPKRGRKKSAVAAKSQELGSKLPFDKYEVVEMHRSELKAAEYNPRIMNDDEKQKLRRGLKKMGMLQPPIWNKRTGVIVGGHQRISQLDLINGSPDYCLQVAVVDMSPSEEREANLLLNNPQAMGDWDLTKLDAMLKDTEVKIDLDGTGFDTADVYRLLGDAPGRSVAELEDLANKLRDFQKSYTSIIEKSGSSINYYVVVVFKDDADRGVFIEKLKLPDNRYQDGRLLMERIVNPAVLQPSTPSLAVKRLEQPSVDRGLQDAGRDQVVLEHVDAVDPKLPV